MKIPFSEVDWSKIAVTKVSGETGFSEVKEVIYNGIKVREVTYSPGYRADHWCKKGHFAYCLSGSFELHIKPNAARIFNAGMSFIVSDDLSEHAIQSETGSTILILDGEFLNPMK